MCVRAALCSRLGPVKAFAILVPEEWDQLKVFRERGLLGEPRILPLCQGGSKDIDSLVLLFDCRTKEEAIRPHPFNVPFPCTDVNFGLRPKESER